MNEAEYRSLLGAYVSDLLDTREQGAVHAHLHSCAACRQEADELADVGQRLRNSQGRIDVRMFDPEDVDLTQLDLDGSLIDNDLILERTLREMRSQRWRADRFRVLAAAGAVVVLLVAGGIVGATLGSRAASPSAGASSAGTRTVSGRDPVTGVRMTASVTPQAGFSRFSARITYEPPNVRCQLIATSKEGTQEVASSWAVGPAGSGATGTQVSGSVAIPITDLRQFDVRTLDGAHVITVAVS